MKKQAVSGTKSAASPLGSETPARQGFYHVTQANGAKLLAEWREHGKNTGKRWYIYVSEDPTVDKKPVELDIATSPVVAFTPASKTDVESMLKRELTGAERIESAYQSILKHGDLDERFDCEIPASRQVQVGDAIEYGSLHECAVVATRENGRIVIFTHRVIETKHGVTRDLGLDYRAVHWTDVLPRVESESAIGQRSRMHGAYMNSTLKAIISRAFRGLDDSPKYQRDYVWTLEDKERFIDSVFAGRELGRFIFIRREFPHVDQVLDGKQRINCLREFLTSRLQYRGLYWHELSRQDRLLFEGRSVQFAELPEERFTPADFIEIFLEVNVAGVPQSEEHLAHVRQMLADERAKEQR